MAAPPTATIGEEPSPNSAATNSATPSAKNAVIRPIAAPRAR